MEPGSMTLWRKLHIQRNLELCKPMMVIIPVLPCSPVRNVLGNGGNGLQVQTPFLTQPLLTPVWFIRWLFPATVCTIESPIESTCIQSAITLLSLLCQQEVAKEAHITTSTIMSRICGDGRDRGWKELYPERRLEAAKLAVCHAPSVPKQKMLYLWCITCTVGLLVPLPSSLWLLNWY